jgi:hypothetical protein
MEIEKVVLLVVMMVVRKDSQWVDDLVDLKVG